MANLTPDEFAQACRNAVKVVQDNMGNILINVTNIGAGEIQDRVFREGKTTSGTQMKYKSKSYIKKRQNNKPKLQVNHKDLIFTGNLFYSMNNLVQNNNEVVYGFNNSETAQIAEYQETSPLQVNQPIFELSDKEVDMMERQFARDVTKIFTSALENYPEMPRIQQRKANKVSKPKVASKTKAKTAKKKLKTPKPKKKPTKR